MEKFACISYVAILKIQSISYLHSTNRNSRFFNSPIRIKDSFESDWMKCKRPINREISLDPLSEFQDHFII